MFAGFAVLLAFQLLGECLVSLLHVPLPGPVVGMTLLALALAWLGRVPAALAHVAEGLLKAMPIFFVPAGVGVLVLSDKLREAWLPIAVALFASTLLAIVVTGLAMKATVRLLSARDRRAGAPR